MQSSGVVLVFFSVLYFVLHVLQWNLPTTARCSVVFPIFHQSFSEAHGVLVMNSMPNDGKISRNFWNIWWSDDLEGSWGGVAGDKFFQALEASVSYSEALAPGTERSEMSHKWVWYAACFLVIHVVLVRLPFCLRSGTAVGMCRAICGAGRRILRPGY